MGITANILAVMEISVNNVLVIVVFLANTLGVWILAIKGKANKADNEKLIDEKIKEDKADTEKFIAEKIRADKVENEKLIDDKIRAAVKPIDKSIAEMSLNFRDQKQQYKSMQDTMTSIFDALEKNADGMEKGFDKLEKSIDKRDTESKVIFRDLWAKLDKKADKTG